MSDQPLVQTGRLDQLCEQVLLRVADEVGTQHGLSSLREHVAPVVQRFVQDNFPKEALTVEAIAETLGLIKPRRK